MTPLECPERVVSELDALADVALNGASGVQAAAGSTLVADGPTLVA